MINPAMIYSKNGLALTEHFEADGGPVLESYWDAIGKVWTIGYGHTAGVYQGMTWTVAQCVAALLVDIRWASHAVNVMVDVVLTQGEFDALVDWTFNEGAGNLKRSTMLAKINVKDFSGANAAMDAWIYGGGVIVPGLVRRRQAEGQLFTS